MDTMQEVLIYLDDSGVLHTNATGRFFVYAGYLFLSSKDKDFALAKYRAAVNRVRKRPDCEIKAHLTKGKTKRYLNSQLFNYESLSCLVDKTRVYPSILNAKRSIHRYKDYCIKRITKAKLIDLIRRGLLDPRLDTNIHLFIDNQPNATNGLYTLRESIFEELRHGIANFDYGIQYPPLFSGYLMVETIFCDSRHNYLIQASDFLANSIFASVNYTHDFSPNQHYHTQIVLP